MKKLQIGNVTLDNPIILAPMAGVSDLPFRLLCREMGAALVCMEMVSAKAIYYNNKNTDSLMEIHPDEVPASLQLFGSDPQILAEMAKRIEERPFSILDLNMGCPVPKVVNNGEGSALMKDPKLVEQILTALVRAIDKPVTVKIRKGFDDDHVNAVEIAKIAEACGVAAVAVHGRTRAQYYSGQADWDIIAQVKDAVKIPVIGNGDVDSPEKAKAILDQTGCDGVMIGRAADNSIVGFVLVNQRTAESHYYPVAGATEESAMQSAEGAVQNLRYSATFPILINVSEQPTYFMALKDNAGTVKKFAMVDIQHYQNVATGDTVAETQKSYQAMLATSGTLSGDAAEANTQEQTGAIRSMTQAVLDGNSHFYVTLEGVEGIYDFALPAQLGIVGYREGDTITFKYIAGDTTNSVQELVDTQNKSDTINKSSSEQAAKTVEQTAETADQQKTEQQQ